MSDISPAFVERRASPFPVTVHNCLPPQEKGGRVHTLNFKDYRGTEESWLFKHGISVGYAYEYEGYYLLSYFESDKLCGSQSA